MKTFTAPLRFIFICIFPFYICPFITNFITPSSLASPYTSPSSSLLSSSSAFHHSKWPIMHLNGFLCELLDTRESSLPPLSLLLHPFPFPFAMKTHASHDYYYYSCCALVPGKAQEQQKLHGKPLAIHLRDCSRCRLPAIRLCLSLTLPSLCLPLFMLSSLLQARSGQARLDSTGLGASGRGQRQRQSQLP